MSFDPGSERLGVALLKGDKESTKIKPPEYVYSDYFAFPRTINECRQKYQEYRLSLIQHWAEEATYLFASHSPDEIVSETVPVVGGGNFVAATVSQLAATAITAIQTIAAHTGIPFTQIGATTVKARIGGSNKATKVKVRNGVIKLFPQLAERKSDWVKIFEEPDAIAIGAAYLGCRVDW